MTSSQLLLNFTVHRLKNDITILSVFNDKVLVSCSGLSQLYINSLGGRHLSTITINDNDKLLGATWTPYGNIIYSSLTTRKVWVMSESSKVIATHDEMGSECYCVSNNIIYFTNWGPGLYQSTDDGTSWSLVFKVTYLLNCLSMIKVTTDHNDDFWMLDYVKYNNDGIYNLLVYSVDRRHSDGNVTIKNMKVTTADNKHLDLLYSRLSYDGSKNIFISDWKNKAVHVLLTNGQYHCKLLSSRHLKNPPLILAVDKKSQLLYVGQANGIVEVFMLTYGNEGDQYIGIDTSFLN